MKYLKSFNESNHRNNDIEIIKKIFAEEIYHSPIAFNNIISKMKDDKLRLGLIAEFVCRGKDYDLDESTIDEIVGDVELNDDLEDAHDYYIDVLNNTVSLKYYNLLINSDEVSEDQEIINFIKTLTEEEFDEIIQFNIDNELYELIPFLKSLR
jgi:hypothetical protein